MPRSLQDIIDHADELASRFERTEPDGDGHRAAVSALRSAVLASADAERAIAEAVAHARDDGMSWLAIGVILGLSGEAARKRYGPMVVASPPSSRGA